MKAPKEKIKKLYNFYTNDLSLKDVENLVRKDVPELYDFYKRKMQKPEKAKNRFYQAILFIKNLVVEFLEQLSPVRRLLFTISVMIFILSYFNNNWQWAGISFILICLLLAFELADKLIAKDELDIARDIQISLMPLSAPENQFFEISGVSENAKVVGGDYYDFIKNNNSDEKLFVIIGDISGKGMAAALHMVQMRSVLHQLIYEGNTPVEILSDLNKTLKRIFKPGTFFTVIISLINPDGSVIFTRAGHLPILIFNKKKDEFINIIPGGIAVGLANDNIFMKSLEQICYKPDAGDIIVFYTDGVIETRNTFKDEYGTERLKNIIRMNKDKSAEEIKDIVTHNISNFRLDKPAFDDLTLVVLKRK
jgi:sigma-B regulation protein RsbU (phosphoserine phosphatase)